MKKRHIFLLLDTSGSMNHEQIGIVNHMFRELFSELDELYRQHLITVDTILFSDDAVLLEDVPYLSDKQLTWFDLPREKFQGRTSLGKAYRLVQQTCKLFDYPVVDTLIVLVTDGLPTDNFVFELEKMDPKKQSKRLSFLLGEKAKSIVQIHTGFNLTKQYKQPNQLIEAIKDVIGHG